MNNDALFAIFGIAIFYVFLIFLGAVFISAVFSCGLCFYTCNCINERKGQHVVSGSSDVTDNNCTISKRRINQEWKTMEDFLGMEDNNNGRITLDTIKTVNWHKSICDSRTSTQENYETKV